MSNPCAGCSKNVYVTEEVKAAGFHWHKLCFKCQDSACGITLKLNSFNAHEGKVYCKTHIPNPTHTHVPVEVQTQKDLRTPKKTAEGCGTAHKQAGKKPLVGYGIDLATCSPSLVQDLIELEKAKARRAEAEAEAHKAEARKAKAETRKAEAEKRKAEARKAEAETRKAEIEASKAEPHKAVVHVSGARPGNAYGADLERLVKEMDIFKLTYLDVWTPSKRTRSQQVAFKQSVIQFYRPKSRGNLNCMILNKCYPRDTVVAVHIWKKCTDGKGLRSFGLSETDVDDPRNGLLLVKPIEEAFDNKQLCFIYNAFNQKHECLIVDPLLGAKQVFKTNKRVRFSDIEGKPLCHPPNAIPYRRLLQWHAKCTIERAKRSKWLSNEDVENIEISFDVSDGVCCWAADISC
eukprot:Colp12_sorted_trinity150504_noHs@13315